MEQIVKKADVKEDETDEWILWPVGHNLSK